MPIYSNSKSSKTTIVDFHRALLHADLCFSNVDFGFLPINQLLISYFISNIKNNFVPHKLSSKIWSESIHETEYIQTLYVLSRDIPFKKNYSSEQTLIYYKQIEIWNFDLIWKKNYVTLLKIMERWFSLEKTWCTIPKTIELLFYLEKTMVLWKNLCYSTKKY